MKEDTMTLFYVTYSPLYATGFFLYALKISQNLWFSTVFRDYRKKPVA